MIRSSCCGWRIRNPNRRSSGNRLRAGADCWNIPPSFHKNSCGRLRRWFRACSGRNRSYIPGTHSACKWHHFHSPEPMYGFRSPGKSKNHTSRNRGLYTHKCRDFLCNGRGSTHSTRHGRARYETAIWQGRRFGSASKVKKNRKTDVFLLFLAPPVGLEPTTLRLTVVVTRISNSVIRFHAV